MIEKLGYDGERIFDVELSPDKKTLEIREACDMYFYTNLTKGQLIELVGDLMRIAEEMDDSNGPQIPINSPLAL